MARAGRVFDNMTWSIAGASTYQYGRERRHHVQHLHPRSILVCAPFKTDQPALEKQGRGGVSHIKRRGKQQIFVVEFFGGKKVVCEVVSRLAKYSNIHHHHLERVSLVLSLPSPAPSLSLRGLLSKTHRFSHLECKRLQINERYGQFVFTDLVCVASPYFQYKPSFAPEPYGHGDFVER